MISISQSIDLVDLFRDRKEEYEKIHTYSHSLISNIQKSLNPFIHSLKTFNGCVFSMDHLCNTLSEITSRGRLMLLIFQILFARYLDIILPA